MFYFVCDVFYVFCQLYVVHFVCDVLCVFCDLYLFTLYVCYLCTLSISPYVYVLVHLLSTMSTHIIASTNFWAPSNKLFIKLPRGTHFTAYIVCLYILLPCRSILVL